MLSMNQPGLVFGHCQLSYRPLARLSSIITNSSSTALTTRKLRVSRRSCKQCHIVYFVRTTRVRTGNAPLAIPCLEIRLLDYNYKGHHFNKSFCANILLMSNYCFTLALLHFSTFAVPLKDDFPLFHPLTFVCFTKLHKFCSN